MRERHSDPVGCTQHEVPAGGRATADGAHLGEERALYVLAGEGTVSLGDEQVRVRAGDYVALPREIVNTGAAPLRYLCFVPASFTSPSASTRSAG